MSNLERSFCRETCQLSPNLSVFAHDRSTRPSTLFCGKHGLRDTLDGLVASLSCGMFQEIIEIRERPISSLCLLIGYSFSTNQETSNITKCLHYSLSLGRILGCIFERSCKSRDTSIRPFSNQS